MFGNWFRSSKSSQHAIAEAPRPQLVCRLLVDKNHIGFNTHGDKLISRIVIVGREFLYHDSPIDRSLDGLICTVGVVLTLTGQVAVGVSIASDGWKASGMAKRDIFRKQDGRNRAIGRAKENAFHGLWAGHVDLAKFKTEDYVFRDHKGIPTGKLGTAVLFDNMDQYEEVILKVKEMAWAIRNKHLLQVQIDREILAANKRNKKNKKENRQPKGFEGLKKEIYEISQSDKRPVLQPSAVQRG